MGATVNDCPLGVGVFVVVVVVCVVLVCVFFGKGVCVLVQGVVGGGLFLST